jgi:hypothetical protein
MIRSAFALVTLFVLELFNHSAVELDRLFATYAHICIFIGCVRTHVRLDSRRNYGQIQPVR